MSSFPPTRPLWWNNEGKTITILLSPPIRVSFPVSPFNCVGCIHSFKKKRPVCMEKNGMKDWSTEHANFKEHNLGQHQRSSTILFCSFDVR